MERCEKILKLKEKLNNKNEYFTDAENRMLTQMISYLERGFSYDTIYESVKAFAISCDCNVKETAIGWCIRL